MYPLHGGPQRTRLIQFQAGRAGFESTPLDAQGGLIVVLKLKAGSSRLTALFLAAWAGFEPVPVWGATTSYGCSRLTRIDNGSIYFIHKITSSYILILKTIFNFIEVEQ